MNSSKSPCCNTTLIMSKRRWPLAADFLDVPRSQATSFIHEFAAHFGIECLRARGNFRQMSFLAPDYFDPLDLHQALEYIIARVNALDANDGRTAALKARLAAYFGPLDGHIAVRLCGWPFVLSPDAVIS